MKEEVLGSVRCSEASCLVSRYLVGVLLYLVGLTEFDCLIRKCAGPLCAAWDDGETLVDLFISMLCFSLLCLHNIYDIVSIDC